MKGSQGQQKRKQKNKNPTLFLSKMNFKEESFDHLSTVPPNKYDSDYKIGLRCYWESDDSQILSQQ